MKKTLTITAFLGALLVLISCASTNEISKKNPKINDLPTYAIGDTAEGGIVFYVNKDGTHGLVAAMQDQVENANYQDCFEAINDPDHHDQWGSQYLDWRLPKLWEAYKMYMNLHMINLGTFSSSGYWTSKASSGFDKMYVLNFSKGLDFTSLKSDTYRARAVRTF